MGIFRKPLIDPKIVATKLASFIWKQKDDGNVSWNAAVRTKLGKMGKEKGYFVYPGVDGPGWLLDLIWMDKKTGAIHLAVESELGRTIEDVKHDFQKLWCVKSSLKIMVYYVRDGGSAVAELEKEMQLFDQHLEGENYILLEFAKGQKRPEDAIYHFRVRKGDLLNGRLQAIKFHR